ncbi:MAG: GIY-YIG nuclease family protein, partial [Demequinaceae bacterium]|nr:GIY-YIG nuclease family protein [Demequinaceae bacterium]
MTDPASYRPEPRSIPTRPGVYRFRDPHGKVIYVGKARNLRNRLTSYFQDPGAL